jgi:hypothetical protein
MGKTVNKSDPYKRVTFREHTVDNRTKSAILWAEKKYLAKAPKKRSKWRIGQGSYNAGGVAGSAGTHDGGGVVDIMFAGVSAKQRKATVKWLRRAGFAAWAREGAAWGTNNDHVHAVLLGHRTLSTAAMKQTDSYRAHRDGLAGNGWDDTPRPKKPRRWNHRLNKPVIKD